MVGGGGGSRKNSGGVGAHGGCGNLVTVIVIVVCSGGNMVIERHYLVGHRLIVRRLEIEKIKPPHRLGGGPHTTYYNIIIFTWGIAEFATTWPLF